MTDKHIGDYKVKTDNMQS